MIRLLRLCSYSNLVDPVTNRSGQIATFLLLMIAGVLVFTMMTANLGQTTVVATRIANVADSSALQLGSSLATKSHALWEGLGHKTKVCTKGGMLGMVLAVVMIIIAIVVAVVTWGAGAVLLFAAQNMLLTMAIGAAVGAVGGAIGGGIAGGSSGALMGAFQGAMLGAAVGGGLSAGASAAGFGASGAGASGMTAGSQGALLTTAQGAQIPVAAGTAVPSTVSGTVVVSQGSLVTASGLAVPAGSTIAGGGAIVGVGGEMLAAGAAVGGAGGGTGALAAGSPEAGMGLTTGETAGTGASTGTGGAGAGAGEAGAGAGAGTGTEAAPAGTGNSELPVTGEPPAGPGEAPPPPGDIPPIEVAPDTSFLPTVQSVLSNPYVRMGQPLFGMGSSIYSASVKAQVLEDALDQFAKAMNGLPEHDQIREGIMLRAFSQVVDDPRKHVDAGDSDKDGDEQEEVPWFQWWWKQRQLRFPALIQELNRLTDAFLDGPLATFERKAKESYTLRQEQQCDDEGGCWTVTIPARLSRQEIDGVDGPVVKLLRGLVDPAVRPGPHLQRNEVYDLSDPRIEDNLSTAEDEDDRPFWEQGPDREDDAWAAWDDATNWRERWELVEENTCEEALCEEPVAGYDEVDLLIDTLKEFVAFTQPDEMTDAKGHPVDTGLRHEARRQNGQLVATWKSWIKILDDPAPPAEPGDLDFDEQFRQLVDGETAAQEPNPAKRLKGMQWWKGRLTAIRSSLPACAYTYPEPQCDEEGNCVYPPRYINNAPCRGAGFDTVDENPDDEFAPAFEALEWILDKIRVYRPAPSRFAGEMEDAYKHAKIEVYAVDYEWEDSRGPHNVTVEVGLFKLAYIKKKTSGNALKKTICMILRDYEDGGGSTYVTITRREPGKDLGLWNWNNGGQTITKTGRASYSFDRVGLAQ